MCPDIGESDGLDVDDELDPVEQQPHAGQVGQEDTAPQGVPLLGLDAQPTTSQSNLDREKSGHGPGLGSYLFAVFLHPVRLVRECFNLIEPVL